MENFLNSFHDKNYEKYLFRRIKFVVEVAKESYKHDLDKKRNRLKELLEAEDLAYENEFRAMVQGRYDETIRQRQETLLKIRNEKIRQNEEFLAHKKAQRLIDNSDKVRTMLSQNLLRETKACNIAQIEEKIRRKEEESKMECLWLHVRNKVLEKDDELQIYENTLKKQMGEQVSKKLKEQIVFNKINSKEDTTSDYIEGGTGSLFYKTLGDDERKTIQRQKNIENQAEMLRYQALKQKLLDENCEVENRLIMTINEQVENELRKERELQRFKPKTAEIFLGYSNDIKHERAKELEQELDSIQLQQAQYQCKELNQYKQRQEKRDRLARQTHDILLGQINCKQTKLFNDTIMQNEQNIAEAELRTRDIEKEKQKQKAIFMKNKQYESELKATAEEVRQRAVREKCIDEEMFKQIKAQSDLQDDVAEHLIKNNDTSLKSHANWRLMECGCKNPP